MSVYAASRQFFDASEQEEGLPGWQQSYMQVSQGKYLGQNDYLALPGLTIMRERIGATVAQQGVAPKDTAVFSFMMQDTALWKIDARDYPGRQLFAALGGISRTVLCQDDSDVLMVSVPTYRLGWDATDMPLLQTISGAGTQAVGQWLAGMLQGAVDGQISLDDDIVSILPDLALDQISNLYFANTCFSPVETSRGAALARRIIAFLDDADPSLFKVSSLAGELGVEQMEIHDAVRGAFGVSANDWLRCLRLDRVRRDLASARAEDRTVSQIALKWQFWHLGRFASLYRTQFGELPSETLQRRG